jgi:ribonuclease PH
MTGAGRFVEVQGTAEREAFSREELGQMLDLAASGIADIHSAQRAVLATAPPPRLP